MCPADNPIGPFLLAPLHKASAPKLAAPSRRQAAIPAKNAPDFSRNMQIFPVDLFRTNKYNLPVVGEAATAWLAISGSPQIGNSRPTLVKCFFCLELMSMNIYVGNLSYDTTEDQLRELFAPFGEVVRASIITDRATGRSRGFGFIEMTDDAQGRQAIEEVNGKELNGRSLTVNEARPRESRPRGGGGGGGRGGYRGR